MTNPNLGGYDPLEQLPSDGLDPPIDEEMRDLDRWEIDLLGMEDVYTRKYYDSIPAWKIQLL